MKRTYRWLGPGDVGECADMHGLAYMLGGLTPYEQDADQGLHLFKITLGKRDEKEISPNVNKGIHAEDRNQGLPVTPKKNE